VSEVCDSPVRFEALFRGPGSTPWRRAGRAQGPFLPLQQRKQFSWGRACWQNGGEAASCISGEGGLTAMVGMTISFQVGGVRRRKPAAGMALSALSGVASTNALDALRDG